MVTKLAKKINADLVCSVLAKILMVTKQMLGASGSAIGSVLAKILMVTKLMKSEEKRHVWFCSSKNPYGNKTIDINNRFF